MSNNQKSVGLFVGISFSIARNSVWHGSDYTELLVKAASHNTYIETLKNSNLPDPDSLHRRIDEQSIAAYHQGFLELTDKYLKKIGNRKVILILDYTHEPFYGNSNSYWIHQYKPEKGCTGCYKFLVASILWNDRRYFVDCIPASIFSNRTDLVRKILEKTGLNIEVVLLDREFASEDVIKLLEAKKTRYLMLVPEWINIHRILRKMKSSYLRQEFKIGKTDTTLVITKDEKLDWKFITSIHYHHINKYIRVYKLRWNIETGFRMQDEARVKSKSLSIKVRYFLFLVSLLLYNVWKYLSDNGYEMQFKRFVINFFDLIEVESIPNI